MKLVNEHAIEQKQRRQKMYGMGEYLMVLHEFHEARMADQARKARSESGERNPEIKASFGTQAREEVGSEGATCR